MRHELSGRYKAMLSVKGDKLDGCVRLYTLFSKAESAAFWVFCLVFMLLMELLCVRMLIAEFANVS